MWILPPLLPRLLRSQRLVSQSGRFVGRGSGRGWSTNGERRRLRERWLWLWRVRAAACSTFDHADPGASPPSLPRLWSRQLEIAERWICWPQIWPRWIHRRRAQPLIARIPPPLLPLSQLLRLRQLEVVERQIHQPRAMTTEGAMVAAAASSSHGGLVLRPHRSRCLSSLSLSRLLQSWWAEVAERQIGQPWIRPGQIHRRQVALVDPTRVDPTGVDPPTGFRDFWFFFLFASGRHKLPYMKMRFSRAGAPPAWKNSDFRRPFWADGPPYRMQKHVSSRMENSNASSISLHPLGVAKSLKSSRPIHELFLVSPISSTSSCLFSPRWVGQFLLVMQYYIVQQQKSMTIGKELLVAGATDYIPMILLFWWVFSFV